MPEWACRKKPARTRRSWLSSWLAASCAFDLVGVQKLLSLLRPSYYHVMLGQNVILMHMQQCLLSASHSHANAAASGATGLRRYFVAA